MTHPRSPWYRGARGEWYVIVQLALLALLVLGPPNLPGLPLWSLRYGPALRVAGAVLVAGSIALFVAGVLGLGPALTPLPAPRPEGRFVERGAYAIVRHPIYAAAVMFACGWALVVHGWLTLVYAALVLVFVDIKSRREERWLVEKYPEYRDYQRRVRRLVPFVY